MAPAAVTQQLCVGDVDSDGGVQPLHQARDQALLGDREIHFAGESRLVAEPPTTVPMTRAVAALTVRSSLSSTTITTATRGYQTNSMRSDHSAIAAVMNTAVNIFRLLHTSRASTGRGVVVLLGAYGELL